MRRILGVLLLAFVLIAGNFVLTTASAEDDSDSGNGSTMHLKAVTVEEVHVDTGEKGTSLGDYLAFTDDLYKDDELVGTNYGTCTLLRYDKDTARLQCVVTVWIDDKGQMTLQGVFEAPAEGTPDPFTIAITGGTEDFRGASGEVEVDVQSDTEVHLTVKLD